MLGPCWRVAWAEEVVCGLGRQGRKGRPMGRGERFGPGSGFWLVFLFSKSISYHSSQNYLNSNEFEFKLLYKQTKQNHAPA